MTFFVYKNAESVRKDFMMKKFVSCPSCLNLCIYSKDLSSNDPLNSYKNVY